MAQKNRMKTAYGTYGRPLHGGDVYGAQPIRLDFSVNINPLGMPEQVLKSVTGHPEDWQNYPDPHCRMFKKALAEFYTQSSEQCLGPEYFICGNGASDLLYSLVFALRPEKALLFAPCFGEYEAALLAGGCGFKRCGLPEDEAFRVPLSRILQEDGVFRGIWEGVDWLILGNPNNPTGRAMTSRQMEQLAVFCEQRGIFLVVDECFQWFLPQPDLYSSLGLLERHENVFLLNAFTKIFSMAGLRLGYGICADKSVLKRIEMVRQPWSVSGPAQRAGLAALSDSDYLLRSRALIEKERDYLEGELLRLGYEVTPSQTNYILFRDPFGGDLAKDCLGEGILIRSCSNFAGLNQTYFRVAVKNREENRELLKCLTERGTSRRGHKNGP